MKRTLLGLIVPFLATVAVNTVHAQASDMTFFITSVGNGKGADFGGLKGADTHFANPSRPRPAPATAPGTPT